MYTYKQFHLYDQCKFVHVIEALYCVFQLSLAIMISSLSFQFKKLEIS